MRRNLLIALFLSVAISLSVRAAVTLEQSTDAEYLINSGYSENLAEDVLIMKNRVTGQPCEPLYEQNSNKFVKFWKKVYSYLDPAIIDDRKYHHDIKLSPHYTDL